MAVLQRLRILVQKHAVMVEITVKMHAMMPILIMLMDVVLLAQLKQDISALEVAQSREMSAQRYVVMALIWGCILVMTETKLVETGNLILINLFIDVHQVVR